eukprot:4440158-Prymnesium_polylepis.1
MSPEAAAAAPAPSLSALLWKENSFARRDMMLRGSLKHLGGGTFALLSGERWHQHPDDGEILIDDDGLAKAFVEANEHDFQVEQVERDVLAALWSISSVRQIQQSTLFAASAKAAVQRSAAKADELGVVRVFFTQGITRALVLGEFTDPRVDVDHPFAADDVRFQFVQFVFPTCGGGHQTVQFDLCLHNMKTAAAAAGPPGAAPPQLPGRVVEQQRQQRLLLDKDIAIAAALQGDSLRLEATLSAQPRRPPDVLGHHLQISTAHGHLKCASLLLAYGAPVDYAFGKQTVLMDAATCGDLPMVMMLVKARANLSLKIADDRTALDLASPLAGLHGQQLQVTSDMLRNDPVLLSTHPWARTDSTFQDARIAVQGYLLQQMNALADAAAAELLGEEAAQVHTSVHSKSAKKKKKKGKAAVS